MKFFCELYDSSYIYVKRCSSVMKYPNELILKGGVKHVSLLLAISIDSDNMVFFFFMHANVLAELVLKRVENIVGMSFSTQYAICIFYIRSIFAWLSCSPLFFATKNILLFLSVLFLFLFLQFLILFNCI